MTKKTFLIREKIIDLIREFFKTQGFHEVETPILVKAPDTAPYNEVFETEIFHKKEIIRAFLTPSPEFFMKKLLAQGYGNIFQICKAFRNQWEKNSPMHNPEFTILEWYRINSNYKEIMIDCEKLINFIYDEVFKMKIYNLKSKILNYQGKIINISPPWIRLSMREAFQKFAGINLDEFLDFRKAKKIAIKREYSIEKETSWEQIFNQIFLNEIEPKIAEFTKPVILYDYPTQLAALSKRKKNDSRYAERFEFYIAGIELGNAFSELTDWREQEERLRNDIKERKRKKMKVFDYDHDFINALKSGIPPTGGIAVGVDRLIMLFTNAKSIDEILFFPTNRVFKKN